MHANQLCVKTTLEMCDAFLKESGHDFKVYSNVAKLTHCWKDKGQSVYTTWRYLFGNKLANAHGKRVMERCVAGRWGSIGSCLERLLAAGQAQVTSVFRRIFGDREGLHPCGVGQDILPIQLDAPEGPAHGLDELGLEEMKIHAAKMGRWRSDTLEAVRMEVCWRTLEIVHATLKPLQHHFNYIQKPVGASNSTGHIAELVDGKAREIMAEFEDLVAHPAWLVGIISMSDASADSCTKYTVLAVLLVLHAACAYHRRVAGPLGLDRFIDQGGRQPMQSCSGHRANAYHEILLRLRAPELADALRAELAQRTNSARELRASLVKLGGESNP